MKTARRMQVAVCSLGLIAGCAGPATETAPESIAASPSSAPVRAAAPVVLTLERALALSDGHPELAEARARADAAVARGVQAGAWPNPSAVARVEAAGSDAREEILAGVVQPLAPGGRLGAAERVERMDAERFALELEAKRRAVRSRVQAAFAGALFAREVLALHNEAVAVADQAVRVARTLVSSGDATEVEVARARMELARARLERDRGESFLKAARIALGAAVGRADLDVAEIEGALEAAIELPALESLARDLESHPLRNAARADVRAREARIEHARSLRIPDVNLELLYRRSDEQDDDSFDAGVSIMLPLFDRGRGRAREARAERRAAEARARSNEIELSKDLRAAHERLSRALIASRTLKEDLVAPQQDILRSFEARHAAGDVSLADILPVRRDLAAARLDYLETLREVLEAWAELAVFMK